jgi:hypothetical protein
MGPIDYTSQVANPFQAAMQGYQGGMMMQADQNQQQAIQDQRNAAFQQQQAAQAAAARQQSVIQSLLSNPNPTADDFARATIAVPGMKDQFQQSWHTMNEARQKSTLSHVSQVYSALQSGAPDVAAQVLQDQATAMRNSGDEAGAKHAEVMANVVKQHPEFARSMVGIQLSAIPGGDKVLSGVSGLNKDAREGQLFPAQLRAANADATTKETVAQYTPAEKEQALRTGEINIANVNSQVQDRAARLGLDKDKLTTETQLELYKLKQKTGELPEFVAKDLNAAATEAVASRQSADRITGLANQIEAASEQLGSGKWASVQEMAKKVWGNQNELTRLRAEYTRIATPEAMGAYKQVASGSTSDRDIDTAMAGVPKDTDNPERMVQFLRGTAKLQLYNSALGNAKAEWLGAVRNLGAAKQDVEIDGVKVPAGTTFAEFTKQYLPGKVTTLSNEHALNAVGDTVYMGYAKRNPSPPPQSGGAAGAY